ncbi:MAG: tyrosine-type recombinase/integrase [Muribaculum sp.]|nr:tyrosine-type recombinase/integrase [Muribaculum sp.]
MNPLEEFENYLRFELRRSPHTVRAYISDFRGFALFKGIDPESDIMLMQTSTEIRSWIAHLSRAKEAPASIRRKLQSIRAFYEFQLRSGKVSDNPARRLPAVKLPSRLPNLIRTEEMETLLSETDSQEPEITDTNCCIKETAKNEASTLEATKHFRNKLIIELLYATGMRRSELLGLNDEDIDFDRAEIKVRGKRNKQRILPLPGPLITRIAEWQRLRDEKWPADKIPAPLLTTGRGRLSESALYNIVKKELAATTAGRKSPHTLRHTFATSMLDAGADINDVKDFLGHASLTATQIYTHVSVAEMRRAYSAAHPRSTKK